MANKFGGEWTREKLVCVRRYLDAYAQVMKNQHHFMTWYIDAFAGGGYVELRDAEPSEFDVYADDAEASFSLLTGSALQALKVEPPFDRFEFIENDSTRARTLAELCGANAQLSGCVNLYNDDANTVLPRICENFLPNDRGVLFLDPFGMNVDWTTLEAVARTECLDVWYLVAISAVNRMLPRTGQFPEGWREKLTRYFGTTDWQAAFYPPKSAQPTLFDEVGDAETDDGSATKAANYRTITAFILQRLKSIFRGGVANNPKILLSHNGSPQFLLCFAVSNPSPAASEPALRIAKYILEMP